MIAATILPLAAGDEQTGDRPRRDARAAGRARHASAPASPGSGFVADLLSNPVRTGYLAGLAVVIFVGQLPKLFGFSTDASGLVAEVGAFIQNLDQTNAWALGIGLLSLGIILGLRRLAPRTPGILVAVVVAIGLSIVLDLASHGVSVIGVLPQGFPMPALPAASPSRTSRCLLAAAVGISLVAIGDTISTSGGFATRGGYEVNGNQELAGIGSANLAAGLFSGFPVSTSGSRTAVAAQSGAKTQLTGLVAAALVLADAARSCPGSSRRCPSPSSRPSSSRRRSACSTSPSCDGSTASAGPSSCSRWPAHSASRSSASSRGSSSRSPSRRSTSSSAPGRRTRRSSARAPGVPGYHDIRRYPDAEQIPGLLIVRWSAPLFFANANQFRDRIRELVAALDPPPIWVLVVAEPITDIDTTAGAMLADLDLELNAGGIHLAFAELQSAVRDAIVRYGLLETIDEGHLYRSVDEAVEAYHREVGS